MPVYDYDCPTCGYFSAIRPMAEYAQPAACQDCGASAPRVILNAPAIAGMDVGARRGMAVNERSRHEPRRFGGGHPPGCGCCTPAKQPKAAAGAAKSFAGRRPWMISH